MIVAELSGGPFERGHQQGAAAPQLHDHVRCGIRRRVDRHSTPCSDVETISLAILDPARHTLAVSAGPPCCSPISNLQL
jgi:hypothetical protein